MCGIIGMISQQPFSIKEKLLRALKRLEYRGYDSVGFATREGLVDKDIGYITEFMNKVDPQIKTTLAISHTRWATHGGTTKNNAHPHTNANKTLFVVHNGIIENFKEIKAFLEKEKYHFQTETDTEVIAHYIDYHMKKGLKMIDILKQLDKQLEGTFAILCFEKEKDTLYALKRDSPLALGICDGKYIVASDIYAFSDETDQAIFFEDGEFAVITAKRYQFYNREGKQITKNPQSFSWTREEQTLEDFPHFMIKEIKEQPEAAKRLINSFTTTQKATFEKALTHIKAAKHIIFIASGSSYHAALIGVILLNKLGYNARAIIASEVETFVQFNKDTLCIAVSQSGETMDVVGPLKKAKAEGAKIISVVNVAYSTIQRLSEVSLECLAGQEICVAATKSFTNQVLVLLRIANLLGYPLDFAQIPKKIQQTIALNEDHIKTLAQDLVDNGNLFVLGRSASYPMAREIALKLKEIPYIHAEGMMAGELKHGTIALIEKGTPVIALIPNNNLEMLSSTKEVEARGASVIAITNKGSKEEYFELRLPESCDAEFAIYACIVGHLLSYDIAVLKNCEIDKPRNLAKSVTVK